MSEVSAVPSASNSTSLAYAPNALSRKALIKRIMWNNGGTSFGLCQMAGQFLWAMDRPGPKKPDLISVVAVGGPKCKYTTEELAQLLDFSERITARHDKICSIRRGANLIVISKVPQGWLAKKLSWENGPVFAETLDKALAIFQ